MLQTKVTAAVIVDAAARRLQVSRLNNSRCRARDALTLHFCFSFKRLIVFLKKKCNKLHAHIYTFYTYSSNRTVIKYIAYSSEMWTRVPLKVGEKNWGGKEEVMAAVQGGRRLVLRCSSLSITSQLPEPKRAVSSWGSAGGSCWLRCTTNPAFPKS